MKINKLLISVFAQNGLTIERGVKVGEFYISSIDKENDFTDVTYNPWDYIAGIMRATDILKQKTKSAINDTV